MAVTGPLTTGRMLLVASFMCFLLSPHASAQSTNGQNAKKKDGMKLFGQSMSWSSDELTRIRDLHSRDFTDKQAFLNSSNLANFLGLSLVESIHMAVPLNFVFVGFAGDGNMAVNYTTEQLQEWFGLLDHVLPHSRIELAELSCAEDGYCAGLVHGHYQAKPVHSAVHLNFTCQVVLVKRRAVVAAFERAIHAFSRPVDVEKEAGMHQVDATKMEAFVDHFVSTLGLNDAYTMVVLNPTWSSAEPAYGYRQGLSAKELDYLGTTGKQHVQTMLRQAASPEPELPLPYARGFWGSKGWHRGQDVDSKFQVNDATWSCDQWVIDVNTYLQKEEEQRTAMMKLVKAGKGISAVVQAVRVLRRLVGPLATTLRFEILGDANLVHDRIMSRFRTMHPAEDCLVGNWVGRKRWVLLDLTAAASDRGPALGGEGVVHTHTLPRVESYFGPLAEERRDKRKNSRFEGSHEADMHKELQTEKTDVLSATSKSEYAAFMAKRKEWEVEAKASGEQSVDVKVELENWGRQYRQALAKAELDMYERFALRHCHDQQFPLLLCADIKEDVDKLRSQISKLGSSGQELSTELFPAHMWDIFGLGHYGDEHYQLGDKGSRAHDFFMADLASILSKGIRHVIAPPTAVWRHDPTYLHDTATPYAKHISFDIYSIQENSRSSDNENALPATFDLAAFQAEVKTLALNIRGQPCQTFDFSVKHINLLDDRQLSAAFAVSLRSSFQQFSEGSDVVDDGTERVFIDSRELSHHMRPFLATRKPPRGLGVVRVPVFIFQLNRDVAVLVDEHYNAKALEDMVLVVQNAARHDEHPTGMMCNGALVSRPLSPLKEALAAVLVYLGGVLPPHLGYNPARKHVTHDWLWSVGAHPLSATAVGLSYTDIQRDALGRSYLLDALDSSVEVVNRGVAALQAARSTHHLHAHVVASQPKLKALLQSFDTTVNTWRTMVGYAFALEWGSAADMIKTLKTTSEEFSRLCIEVSTAVEHLQCKGRTHDPMARYIGPVLTGSAALAVAAALYAILPVFTGARGSSRGPRPVQYSGMSL